MKVQKNRKKNSKEIKTTTISRRSTIAERSWSATSTGHRAVQVVDVGALLILEHGTGRRRLLTTEPIPSAFLVSVLHTVSGFGSGHSARGPALPTILCHRTITDCNPSRLVIPVTRSSDMLRTFLLTRPSSSPGPWAMTCCL